MPQQWQENLGKWRAMHPGRVRLWDKKSTDLLLTKVDPDFKSEVYDKFPHPIQRVDAIRYFILREFGGMYVDLDMTPRYPMDYLLQLFQPASELEVVLTMSPNSGIVTNCFMLSIPKSQFWDVVIAKMRARASRVYMSKHFRVMETTGPNLVHAAMLEMNDPQKVQMLPGNLVSRDVCQDDNAKTAKFVFRVVDNQHAGSWHDKQSDMMESVFCFSKNHPWRTATITSSIVLLIVSTLLYAWWRCNKRCPATQLATQLAKPLSQT
tara:strand:+ start:15964 stop:16758 length:795 start_codon:yes stop_codon:yes gene_type:complete